MYNVQPQLEYAVPVCDPHFCKDIDMLESVQRFATKICTKSWNANALHYQDRLEKLHLDTLHKRRAYLKQCHLYKLVHGLSVFQALQSPIIRYSIIKEATIRIAKTTIRFSTSLYLLYISLCIPTYNVHNNYIM